MTSCTSPTDVEQAHQTGRGEKGKPISDETPSHEAGFAQTFFPSKDRQTDADPLDITLATIKKLVFGAHSGLLATSCVDGSTRVFSVPLNNDGQQPLVESIENVGPIYQEMPNTPVFADDDQALITLRANRELSVTTFSSSTSQQLGTRALKNQGEFFFDTFSASPDGRHLLAGTSTGAAIWDIATRSPIKVAGSFVARSVSRYVGRPLG